jgi:hypothetical protein
MRTVLGASALAAVVVLGGCSSEVTLDDQTSSWFDALCTGLAPVTSAGTAISGGDSSDPKTQLDTAVGGFNAIGDALGATADRLASLPPPTIEGGATSATGVVNTLKAAGPEVKQAANALAASPATDAASVKSAIATAASAMTNSVAGLNPGAYQLDKPTQAAIRKIPSCAAVGFGAS